MSTQTVTILTCDECKSDGDAHNHDDTTTAWMKTHGWQHIGGRDLCPACLMDQDAADAKPEA